MHIYLKYALFALIVALIWWCIDKQRHYWQDLTANKPAKSVRAAYTVATMAIGGSLGAAVCFNTPEMWVVFRSVLTLAIFFCLKVTFSPAMIGVTLAICAWQLHVNETFPVMAVWAALLQVLTYQIPEGVRAYYNYFSFAWVVLVFILPARSVEETADVTVDGLTDALDMA